MLHKKLQQNFRLNFFALILFGKQSNSAKFCECNQHLIKLIVSMLNLTQKPMKKDCTYLQVFKYDNLLWCILLYGIDVCFLQGPSRLNLNSSKIGTLKGLLQN